MEILILLSIPALMIFRWLFVREKFKQFERRFEEMEAAIRRIEWARAHETPRTAAQPVPASEPPVATPEREAVFGPPVETAPPVPPVPPPPVVIGPRAEDFLERPAAPTHPTVPPPAPEPVVSATAAPVPQPAPAIDWEVLIGGNILLKLGVFVFVIGIAYWLRYEWQNVGPAGRVAMSYATALAMLGGGVWSETRNRFRTFGYGLIGGGWAAVYLTTYAMYAIPEAKILDNAFAATALLLLIAIGMVAHSLKYRSETLTALAAGIAFVTLAISDVTIFSVVALIPLAAALLYIAYRNDWARFAIFGLIATYVTCAFHKDTGAPLWQTQSLFLVYWILFEVFDLLRANPALFPLNALGFLTLSLGKWEHTAPNDIWQLAAGASALYLISTALRARSGRWRPAVTLQAALAVASIFLKLHNQEVPLALLIAAELYYLAGCGAITVHRNDGTAVSFRSRWLQAIAACLFTLEVGHLVIGEVNRIPLRAWEPVAVATIAVFYLNRFLRPADVIYGYVAAGLGALVSGLESTAETVGRVWSLLAFAPFALGWARRQVDFRIQGYALAVLGAIATSIYAPHPPITLAVGAAAAYAFVQIAIRSAHDRFPESERDTLRLVASIVTSAGLTALVWKLVPADWLGVAWLALGAVLLEAGLLNLPREFRVEAGLVALFGVTRVIALDMNSKLTLISAALTYLIAFRSTKDSKTNPARFYTFPATLLLLAGLNALLPEQAVSPAWALVVVALLEIPVGGFDIQAVLVSTAVFIRCIAMDFETGHTMLSVIPVIACYAIALVRRDRASFARTYFALATAGLTAILIFDEVSGSMLTIAWGLEGVALLVSGFPLRDRILRLSGLTLLIGCIGKLFIWDLRNLDTLPRIFSFVILGALLVAVSWIYTRFRETVQKFL
jgi:uncharacterized membrane protein